MKKIYIFLLLVFSISVAAFAQGGHDKISYQSVVRDGNNHLVYNTQVTVAVSIANHGNPAVVYSETHTEMSNDNGLISFLIGDGNSPSGDWDAVQWNRADITLVTSVGGVELSTHTFPLSAVPYALHAKDADTASYADSVDLDVVQHYLDDNGYLPEVPQVLSISNDTIYLTRGGWVKLPVVDYNNLSNKPDLAPVATSGNYDDLVNKPQKTDLCDSVKDCVMGWISDSTRMVIDSLNAYYDTTRMKTAIHDTAEALRSIMSDAANDARITIKKNGAEVDHFTVNQSEDQSINILIPTKVTDLTDADNYVMNAKLKDTLGYYAKSDTLKKYLTINGLCDSVKKCEVITTMQTNITNVTNNLDSTKTNIRNEINSKVTNLQNADIALSNRITADSNKLVNNYYNKTDINDTLDDYAKKDTLKNYLTINGLCDSVKKCEVITTMQTNITNVTNNLDSTKTNIRNEINSKVTNLQNADIALSNRITADSNKLVNNYYNKTDINDTLDEYAKSDTLKNYLTINGLCDSVKKCEVITTMQTNITDVTNNLDTTKQHIRGEINSKVSALQNADVALSNRITADSNKLVNNYYTRTQVDSADNKIRSEIGDGTLTIQQNGVNVGTFKANQNTGELINITVPAAPGTLNTNNDTAIAVNSSEALSGTVKLHKVAKTGSYEDLLYKPTVPAAANNGTLTIQYGNNTLGTFTANQPDNQNVSVNIPAYNDGCSDTTFCELLRIVRSLQDEINQLHNEVDHLKDQVGQLEAANCPTLGSVTVSDVTFGSATFTATINNYDPLTVQGCGFMVSTEVIGDYDAAIAHPVDLPVGGEFTWDTMGLLPGTTYYVKAYVLNNVVRCTQATMVSEQTSWQTEEFAVTLSSSSFCKGESVDVSVPDLGGAQYVWEIGQNDVWETDSYEFSFTDTPEASGVITYRVTATYGNNIEATASATATVKPMPDATITTDPASAYDDGTTQVFIGTTELTLSVEEQTNAEYAWSTGANTHSIEVSPTEDTKYVVTVTIGDCEAKDSVTARIDVCPSLSKVSVAPTPSAEGSVDLSATMSMFTGEINDLGFIMTTDPTWTSNVDTLHISPITMPVTEFSLTKPGLVYNIPYYFKAYMKPNSIECTAEIIVGDTAKFMFQDENFKITINKDSVCADDTVTLVAPEGGTEYVWSTGETTPIIKVVQNEAATKIYTVTVSIDNVSKAVGVKVTTTLNHMVLYADSIASNTLKFYLLDNVTGANYVWKKNGEIITGAATNSYSVDYANLNDNDTYGVSVSLGNCTVKDSVRVSWVTDAVRHCGGATVADHQGNVYNTIYIGDLCWTRENMRATQYYDEEEGQYIDIPDGSSELYYPSKPYLYNPNNRSTTVYGYLYNWLAATGNAANILPNRNDNYTRGICPEGWHLPSYNNVNYLVNSDYSLHIYDNPNASYNAGMLAGGETWMSCCLGESVPGNYNYEKRDSTGFSAIQAGRWDRDPEPSGSFGKGGAWFWTSLAADYGDPDIDNWWGFIFWINNDDASVEGQIYNIVTGASVRCVRDPQPTLSLSSDPDGGTVSFCGGNSATVEYTATLENVDPEGYSYSWSVSPAISPAPTSTTSTLSLNYSNSGTYKVSCIATKGDNTLTASVSTTVNADGEMPSVNFCVDSNLTVTVSSTTGAPTSIQWGDGETDNSITDYITYHHYSVPGTYTIKVINNSGCKATYLEKVSKPHTTCSVGKRNILYEAGSGNQIDSVRDHQNNWYEVVKIGDQCWLKENMRCTTSPSTGASIVYIPSSDNDNTVIQSYTSKIAHWYNNDSSTYAPKGYGLLYNWCAAVDTFKTGSDEVATGNNTSNQWSCTFTGHRRGICPKGWHVPTTQEWYQMETVVNNGGGGNTLVEYGSGFKGSHSGKLSTGCDWTSNSRISNSNSNSPGDYNSGTRNSSGFSALPAGDFSGDSFFDAGPVAQDASSLSTVSIFWTATEASNGAAWIRRIICNMSGVQITNYDKGSGYSVRCVRDEESGGSAQTGNLIHLNELTGDYEAQYGDTLVGTLTNPVKVSIADGAVVTLRGIKINDENENAWAGITCEGDAAIILERTNTVTGPSGYPGIFVKQGKTLFIEGPDSLIASSNGGGAGIGGGYRLDCGNLVISGGTIIATGGVQAAGIGSGTDASCGYISINHGKVIAEGGQYGAGIGTGIAMNVSNSCGNITICGDVVNVQGGDWGAGVGTGLAYNGRSNTCGSITISGGTVNAKGGQYAAGVGAGMGNAGLASCTCTSICISGGTVSAQGGDRAAGIGAGRGNNGDSECGDIIISGGEVIATGGHETCVTDNWQGECNGGAGIGTAYATQNYSSNSKCGNITIKKTVTRVTAIAGAGANSIGKDRINSDSSTCGKVTIGGTEYWNGSTYQNGGGDTYGLPYSPYVYQPQP